jgi:hypothetical protein
MQGGFPNRIMTGQWNHMVLQPLNNCMQIVVYPNHDGIKKGPIIYLNMNDIINLITELVDIYYELEEKHELKRNRDADSP